MSANNFTVGRETAAAEIGVSTRTLDRWLKSGKLKFKTEGRAVFLNAKDVAQLAKELGGKTENKTGHASSEPNFTIEHKNSEEKIFQRLYEEATSELKAKQEKLEAAGFRVGQLETQLKNSVPLLEYKQKEDELRREAEVVKENLVRLRLKNNLLLVGVIALAGIGTTLAVLFFGRG